MLQAQEGERLAQSYSERTQLRVFEVPYSPTARCLICCLMSNLLLVLVLLPLLQVSAEAEARVSSLQQSEALLAESNDRLRARVAN